MAPSFDEFLARLRAEAGPRPAARYGAYRSYQALFEAVGAMRDGGAVIEQFGRSAGGEPLWAVRLGPATARARVLFLGGLHAQEFVGVEAALAAAGAAGQRIAAADPRFDGLEVTCVPVANPDGYRRAARDAARVGLRFHRRNDRGVDLNRNFSEGFDADAPLTRLLPFLYHPGPAPLSEPETAALDVLFQRRFHRAISFHSFGGWIFWPWAAHSRPTLDDARFGELAEKMRSRMRTPYRAIQLGRWARWFRAGGAEIDHLYGRYHTLAFLIEVSRGGRSLSRPTSWLDAFAWFNPPDIGAAIEDVVAAALALAEGPWPPGAAPTAA